ncbi:MAG: alpha-E domain-containing protein [Vicinamibacteria bacterium]
MLSRVAESLYWMSRYIERAEDLTRLLTVNFMALLDTGYGDGARGWEPIVAITGDQDLFGTCFDEIHSRTVSDFILWHPANPNAVVACVNKARENARGVREQVSTEMWEHLNRLYFLVKDADHEAVLRGPHDFFGQIRSGSQAFQGVTAATMTHGEGYEFLQLGRYLERAEKTVRILDVKYAAVSGLRDGSPEASLQLIALLRSCSAFEPFRRTAVGQLQAARVTEFLLLSRDFPRAVLFCLNRCRRALELVGSGPDAPVGARQDAPARALGRLVAELQYLDVEEVLGDGLRPYLDGLLRRINAVHNEMTHTYFNTQVILPDPRPQQQQQQQ